MATRIAVLGSGAMGAIFGAALIRSGAEVVFFDKRRDVVEAIGKDGLRLSGVLGEFVLRAAKLPLSRPSAKAEGHPLPPGGEGGAGSLHRQPHPAVLRQAQDGHPPRKGEGSASAPGIAVTGDPSAIGKVDVALVLVDSNASAEAAKVAELCLKDDGFALTLQNGIGNWEALAERLGKKRVLAGSTYNSGANLGPGRSAHTNRGETVLGELDGTISSRAKAIAARFTEAGLPTAVSENVEGHIWSKFVHNCAINPVAAVSGMRVGEIARDPNAAKMLDTLLDEILLVVKAAGIALPDASPREEMRDHCWGRFNRPSMLQHIQSGRGTEIDALNGALVKRARALGVPVPANEVIVAMVKALEAAGRRDAAAIDEKALEAKAAGDPRNGRWGEG